MFKLWQIVGSSAWKGVNIEVLAQERRRMKHERRLQRQMLRAMALRRMEAA